jgi:hypothetical protein
MQFIEPYWGEMQNDNRKRCCIKMAADPKCTSPLPDQRSTGDLPKLKGLESSETHKVTRKIIIKSARKIRWRDTRGRKKNELVYQNVDAVRSHPPNGRSRLGENSIRSCSG